MAIKHIKALILMTLAIMLFVLPVNAAVTSTTVLVTPTSPDTEDTLNCFYSVQGNESTYLVNVSWYKNGTAHTGDSETNVVLANGTTGTNTGTTGDIESSDTAKTELWICAINVEGTEYTSAAVTIQNSAPVLTSITDKNAFTDVLKTISVSATDADSETLTYSLTTAPTGMAIASGTGSITWTPNSNQNGSHSVVVSVTDGTDTDTESFTVTVIDRKFEIDDLDISCSEDCDEDVDEDNAMNTGDGGSVTEVLPGQTLTLEITLENLWSDDDDEDYDIEDIEIEVNLEEMGDEDDQDDDENIDKIKAEDEETVEFSFDIPDDADEDTYDLDVEITAEDEAGNDYSFTFTIEVEVEKEDNSMIFQKAQVTPSTVTCDRQIELWTKIKNIGADDQDDVQLVITSSPLKISEAEFFDLESGDYDDDDTEFEEKYTFYLPDSVKAGTYQIELKAYYEDDDEYERTLVPVTIDDCSSSSSKDDKEEEEEEEEEPQVVIIQQPQEQTQTTTSIPSTQEQGPVVAKPVTTVQSTSDSFWNSTAFVVILVIVFLLLLGGVVYLAYLVFAQK